MPKLPHIFWRVFSAGLFLLLALFLYYRGMEFPDDFTAWLATTQATSVVFLSFLLLLLYLATLLFFSPEKPEKNTATDATR